MVSMVLFIAYPSVSIKIFRLFNCRKVDGHYWIAADMRLRCFTKQWWVLTMKCTVLDGCCAAVVLCFAALCGLCCAV